MACYERLRELREDHDKTQRNIAALLGMPQSQYWRYECGYRDIPSDILIRLADYYDVSTDYILGRTDCCCSINRLTQCFQATQEQK